MPAAAKRRLSVLDTVIFTAVIAEIAFVAAVGKVLRVGYVVALGALALSAPWERAGVRR